MKYVTFPPDTPPKTPPLKVRFDGHYYVCACGDAMMFGEGLRDAPQRRIVCANPKCNFHGQVYLEPVLEAFPL